MNELLSGGGICSRYHRKQKHSGYVDNIIGTVEIILVEQSNKKIERNVHDDDLTIKTSNSSISVSSRQINYL